ncbi:tocopherol cyclase family protein [Pleomorphochaeta sp. DL1XJH-081]|jgi:hypothetical protein|uniref:tocopherol cyclase family protein n=1 Tax=Pleomorphochaeta sp. DL1XJH-081 TaxID=3409690 RepID=UPI003BB7B62E
MSLYTLFHPPVFQGRKKNKAYFEGWYFKMVKDGQVLAIIPGISLESEGKNRHAFIQVYSSASQKSWYITYPFESFHADKRNLDIRIGENHFTTNSISLHIETEDLSLAGQVNHENIKAYPVTITKPGIMGWYAYVPFMECFHGVVSMHHSLQGTLFLNGDLIDWSQGDGYIEKDWGTSFPSSWIWMQSNCFPSKGNACMLSVANIPFLGKTFTGFLGFVFVEGRLIQFGTYTGAKIVKLQNDGKQSEVVVKDKKYTIRFLAELGPTAHLAAPRQGKMDRKIQESIKGSIYLEVIDHRKGFTIIQETGSHAGIELCLAPYISSGTNEIRI